MTNTKKGDKLLSVLWIISCALLTLTAALTTGCVHIECFPPAGPDHETISLFRMTY